MKLYRNYVTTKIKMINIDYRINLFYRTVEDMYEFPNGSVYLFDLIDKSWKINPLDTIKIIFNWRDCREGKGNCDGALSSLLYIEYQYTEWFECNFKNIPKYGSWLDLIKLWHFVNYDKSKDSIMDFLIDTLENDLKKLENNEEITLLAKWIPSENSKWDRIKQPRFIIELCKNLFCINKVSNDHIRELRKNILSPLRKKIDLIETRICKGQHIDYEKVPSNAMNKYKKIFIKRDAFNFIKYLEELKPKEYITNFNELYPHDLVKQYLDGHPEDPIIEEKWIIMKERYKFTDSVAVCDVSGSMHGLPMCISIALSLLCLHNNRLITFSEIPEIHYVPDGSLYSQVQSVKDMMWGSIINIEYTMDLILKHFTDIKKVYIFTDMYISKAINDVKIENIKEKYIISNIKLPQIIFWNLHDSQKNDPIINDHIILLYGYSTSILKCIEKNNINQLNLMLNVINSSRYDVIKSPET